MGKDGDELTALIKEIDKIVSAPYPVLFKALTYTLSRVDNQYVDLWTIVKKCQVQALVSRLLSSLNEDEEAQTVLLHFLQNATIRDEILKQDFEIAQKLFGIVGEQNVDEVRLAIYQSPRFNNVAPSSQHKDFIEAILTNARAESISVWICKMHTILSDLSIAALSAIDQNIIQQCIGLWTEASKSAESSTFILFVSVASIVHRLGSSSEFSLSHSSITLESPGLLSSWVLRCSSFFANPKAHKMLKSLLLHTLHFVSDECSAEKDRTICVLEKVRTILEAFPRDVLDTILEDVEITPIVSKLLQKSNAKHISMNTRLVVSGIMLALDPKCRVWEKAFMHESFTSTIYSVLDPPQTEKPRYRLLVAKHLRFQQTYPELWQLLLEHCLSMECVLGNVMQHLVDLCRPGITTTAETTLCLQAARSFLANILGHETDIDSDICNRSSIAATELPEWWDWDIRASPVPCTANCHGLATCPNVYKVMQNNLAADISLIIMRSSCNSANRISQTKFNILCSVINRHVSTGESVGCRWPATFQQYNAQSGNQHTWSTDLRGCDAQEQLNQKLESLRGDMMDVVWEYVDRVCYDLQRRCQSIETPLRIEQARAEALEKELTDSKNATELMLADHRARSLLWQHDLEVECQKTLAMEARQADLEHDLIAMKGQLEDGAQRHHALQQKNHDLSTAIAELQAEIEQGKLILKDSNTANARLTTDNIDLTQQLLEAQQKEQQLLRVLRGEWSKSV